MERKIRLLFFLRHFLLFVALLFWFYTPLSAGDPYSAYYSSDHDKLLWFIHASDTHLGTRGTTDTTNLQWLVSQAKTVINPSFIVVTGDLTDSTNGNILGFPNGPYQAEWDQYKSILSSNGVDASFYYDIPGNHDAYNDQYFNYYLANSVQGRATGRTQASWIRIGAWGKYHFLGVNSADNTGAPFSISWPYGDNAGLDSSELSFISSEMVTHGDAALTLVFGHHPLAPTGNNSDTYLFYGKDEFLGLMGSHGASLYGYGHTHVSSEQFFVQNMDPGVFYFNVAALGKDSPNQYTVTAIDCNGISSVTQTVGAWPVVLITAPLDRHLGGIVNPYAYTVTNAASNPIRALVFDPNGVTQVQFRINGGVWQPMADVSGNPRLWQGVWDASNLPEGEHTVEVQATTGSGVRVDTVTTYLTVTPDTAPPDTSITDGPSGGIAYNNPTFSFTGIDNVTPAALLVYATYLQGYDSGWSSFSLAASKSYNNLPDGSYTFQVKAKDQTGNEDQTPSTRSFTVSIDTIPPSLSITSHTDDQHVATPGINLTGTASDSGKGDKGISQVTVNGTRADNDTAAGSGTANWSKTITLTAGANSITITAYDNSTNHNQTTRTIHIYYDPSSPINKRQDFNNDGNPDILWRNQSTGEVAVWLMNGTTLSSGVIVAQVPLDWDITGTGDFNYDGRTDILWRNLITGDVAVWLMNGTTMSSGAIVAQVPLDWDITGTGDFNNDGYADILWRNHITGDVAVWLMNGTTMSGGAIVAQVPLDWDIAGTGDFNYDGRTDILWRNHTSGDVAVWLMNGTTLSSGAIVAQVPLDWDIAGTGDFNNDGYADILWRNHITGDAAVWLMNGTTLSSGAIVANVPLDWDMVGTGDFNHDGCGDIVWRNSITGQEVIWHMNGTSISGLGWLPEVGDLNWKVMGK